MLDLGLTMYYKSVMKEKPQPKKAFLNFKLKCFINYKLISQLVNIYATGHNITNKVRKRRRISKPCVLIRNCLT